MATTEQLETYTTTFNADYATKAVRAAGTFDTITGCEIFPLRSAEEISDYGAQLQLETSEIFREVVERDLIICLGKAGTHAEVGVRFTSEGRFPFSKFYEIADAMPDVQAYS